MGKRTLRWFFLALVVAVGLALPAVAQAAPPCGSINVLILSADSTGPPDQLRAALLAESGVTTVDVFDATLATPTLDELSAYNVVLPFSNSPFLDADAIGNVLADYQDSGSGFVVPLSFSVSTAQVSRTGSTGAGTPTVTRPSSTRRRS